MAVPSQFFTFMVLVPPGSITLSGNVGSLGVTPATGADVATGAPDRAGIGAPGPIGALGTGAAGAVGPAGGAGLAGAVGPVGGVGPAGGSVGEVEPIGRPAGACASNVSKQHKPATTATTPAHAATIQNFLVDILLTISQIPLISCLSPSVGFL